MTQKCRNLDKVRLKNGKTPTRTATVIRGIAEAAPSAAFHDFNELYKGVKECINLLQKKK